MCSWSSLTLAPAVMCWRPAELAKRNGATLIAVTSFRQTQLRQMADMVLDTLAEENELRISSISSRTAQNTITDILFLGLVQRRDEWAWALIGLTVPGMPSTDSTRSEISSPAV